MAVYGHQYTAVKLFRVVQKERFAMKGTTPQQRATRGASHQRLIQIGTLQPFLRQVDETNPRLIRRILHLRKRRRRSTAAQENTKIVVVFPTTTTTTTTTTTSAQAAAQAQAPRARGAPRPLRPNRRPSQAPRPHAHNATRRGPMGRIRLRPDRAARYRAPTRRPARSGHRGKRGGLGRLGLAGEQRWRRAGAGAGA